MRLLQLLIYIITGRRPIPKEGSLELKAEYGEKLVDPKMDNNDDWSSGDDDDLVDPRYPLTYSFTYLLTYLLTYRYSYSRRMAKMKDGTASSSSIDSNYSNNNTLVQAYDRNTVNNKVCTHCYSLIHSLTRLFTHSLRGKLGPWILWRQCIWYNRRITHSRESYVENKIE